MHYASKSSFALIMFAVAAGVPGALLSCKGEDEPSKSEQSMAGTAGEDGSGARGGGIGGGKNGSGGSRASGGTQGTGGASASRDASTSGDACTPSCSGTECGSDGCGGSCGTCGSGSTCDASGQCVSTGRTWPNASNTGVPVATALTTYTNSCTITTDGTVVDSKTVNCDLVIRAANVVIKNSKVNGLVYLDTDQDSSKDWSLTLQDSEVDAGPVQRAAVSDGNMTILRANIYGGETAVHCGENALTCRVQDSWLHGQYMPDNVDWHLGGFLSNGGTNIQLVHNTVICDHPVNNVGGGCTGDINLIPDWATISYVTVDNNFLGANIDGSYCTYGGEKSTSDYPHANHIVYRNNVFARGTNHNCGAYGPVTSFDVNGTGNVWTNNTWEDGGPVQPAN